MVNKLNALHFTYFIKLFILNLKILIYLILSLETHFRRFKFLLNFLLIICASKKLKKIAKKNKERKVFSNKEKKKIEKKSREKYYRK